MQPRGQLWFELQRVCKDFRQFSGLGAEESLRVLVTVLRNLLAEQEQELAKLTGQEPTQGGGPEAAGPSP